MSIFLTQTNWNWCEVVSLFVSESSCCRFGVKWSWILTLSILKSLSAQAQSSRVNAWDFTATIHNSFFSKSGNKFANNRLRMVVLSSSCGHSVGDINIIYRNTCSSNRINRSGGGAAAPCTPASYSSAILTLRWKLFLCRSSIAAAMSLTFLEISASLRFIFSLRHQHAWSQTRVCGSINFFNFSTSLMTFASSCFSSTFS